MLFNNVYVFDSKFRILCSRFSLPLALPLASVSVQNEFTNKNLMFVVCRRKTNDNKTAA